jgi:hypothetical protein
MFKSIFYILVVLSCSSTLLSSIQNYKKEKEISNFLEVLGRILLIPSGIILLIVNIID